MPTHAHAVNREVKAGSTGSKSANRVTSGARVCVNAYGGTTALMPFYGATAEDAALALTKWLSRIHKHAAEPAVR